MSPEEMKELLEVYGADSPEGGDGEAKQKQKPSTIKDWLYNNFVGPESLAGVMVDRVGDDLGAANTAGYSVIDALTFGGASRIPGYQENRDYWKDKHPGAYLGGNVAGSIYGAGKFKKGFDALKAAKGVVGKMAQEGSEAAGKNIMTRSLAAGTSGAVAGGVTAFNEGEFTPGGAAIGGLVSAALSPAGEAGMALAKRLGGTNAGQQVIEKVSGLLARSPKMQGYDTDTLLKMRQALGDDAVLADLDPTMRDFADVVMRDPKNYDDSLPLYKLMGERMNNLQDPSSTLKEKFTKETDSLMQPFFDMDVSVGRPRTPDEVTSAVRESQKQLQPLYNEVLGQYDNWGAKPDNLSKLAEMSMRGGKPDGPISASGEESLSFINRRIGELAENAGGKLRPQELQKLRLDLSPKITTMLRNGDRDGARELIAVKDTLENDFLSKLPGYNELNSRYATEEGYRRGMELGQNFFKMKPDDYDNLSLEMSALSPADRKGFYESMSRSLFNELDSAGSTKAMVKKLNDNKSIRRGLDTAFGPDVAAQFINEAEKMATMTETATKLSARPGISKQLVKSSVEDSKHATNVGMIISGALRTISSKIPGMGQTGAAGAAARVANEARLPKAQTKFANELLTKQGPALDPYLEDIAKGKLNPSRNPATGSLIDSMQNDPVSTGQTAVGLGAAAAQQGNVSEDAQRERWNLMQMGN